MRRPVTTGLVVALIALTGCSGESKLTQTDLDICFQFLNMAGYGRYDTAELLPTSTDEYVLKTSPGIERRHWWQKSVPHVYDIIDFPWESSKMKRFQSKAEKLLVRGNDTFLESLDPDEWRQRLDEAGALRDEVVLACEG